MFIKGYTCSRIFKTRIRCSLHTRSLWSSSKQSPMSKYHYLSQCTTGSASASWRCCFSVVSPATFYSTPWLLLALAASPYSVPLSSMMSQDGRSCVCLWYTARGSRLRVSVDHVFPSVCRWWTVSSAGMVDNLRLQGPSIYQVYM